MKKIPFLFLAVILAISVTGCGGQEKAQTAPASGDDKANVQETSDFAGENGADVQEVSGIAGESAQDAHIDFAALKKENPDIFAWIYVPGTKIDYPVLQSEQADDFYEKHDASGEENPSGAVYIELANLNSMCDFNTVLHGKTGADGNGLFADLYRYAEPDFFEQNEEIIIYLDGNVLTYEIFAAYERENTSLIRSYDFTYLSGCQEFLDDMYQTRDMGRNLREGWEDVTPYHFLITLTTQKEDNDGRQFVVVAALIKDAAGTIDRVVTE